MDKEVKVKQLTREAIRDAFAAIEFNDEQVRYLKMKDVNYLKETFKEEFEHWIDKDWVIPLPISKNSIFLLPNSPFKYVLQVL